MDPISTNSARLDIPTFFGRPLPWLAPGKGPLYELFPEADEHELSVNASEEGTAANSDPSSPTSDSAELSSAVAEDEAPLLPTMSVFSKFGKLGSNLGQFNFPHGFCLGFNETIVVADTKNHRIQVFNKQNQLLFHFGCRGFHDGQLYLPRKVVIDQMGRFVVCDQGRERSRLQVFDCQGTFLKRIAMCHAQIVAGLLVSARGLLVYMDSVKPTIYQMDMKSESFTTIDCHAHVKEPSDIVEYQNHFYVCDFKGHSIVVIHCLTGSVVSTIPTSPQTWFPNGIDISEDGHILVGDSHGNFFHVSVYDQSGQFLHHYYCYTIKLSRCAGLKLTNDGYIITLAKNNHHLLIFNKLPLP